MTWTKLSDDFTDDTWTLSDAAHRLHVDGLVWSNRKLLDLRIPKADLARVSPRAEVVPELLDAGFWVDDSDAYVIRHHARYQRTREQVLKQQETNKANRARGVARPVREQHSVDERLDESSDERSDARSDERDGTGRLVTEVVERPSTSRRPSPAGTRPDDPKCVAPGCSASARNALRTCFEHARLELTAVSS